MPTQIEADAKRVLEVLCGWALGADDANEGRYAVTPTELQEATDLSKRRIEDAVDLLQQNGYVEARSSLSGLQDVAPTTSGRNEFLRMRQQEANALTESQYTYDVFLSHSALDNDLATDVKSLLEANEIRTFSTPGSIPTGKWEPQIEEALQQSRTIWVLLTSSAFGESVWVHHEFGYFYGHRHGREQDLQGHSCRFLYTDTAQLRGLYREIQGVRMQSLENPVEIAKTIASNLGVADLTVPPGFIRRRLPQQHQQLDVTVKSCRLDTKKHPFFGTVMAVDVLFAPTNPPIQLASVTLLFENTERPALAMPTKLIERDQAETFLFGISSESAGRRLIEMGLNQGEQVGHIQDRALTEREWPKARLHIVAGALDFQTEPFLAPTPTRPLAPDTAGSQNLP